MNDVWVVKDANGNVTNPAVSANEAFMEANFEFYEAYVPQEIPAVTDEQEARIWRDIELKRTDTLHLLDDYPNASNLTTYRAELRAWPSTSDFPDTKPTL
jgi:hypothetical protein|tara:strand:+ start:787 stop:1086 length:300 start_codon:yes stop_codon:yes gene_type:complete